MTTDDSNNDATTATPPCSQPMDPEKLAELRSRIEPCANGTAIRFPIFGWGDLSEVLAHADHWEAEAKRLRRELAASEVESDASWRERVAAEERADAARWES